MRERRVRCQAPFAGASGFNESVYHGRYWSDNLKLRGFASFNRKPKASAYEGDSPRSRARLWLAVKPLKPAISSCSTTRDSIALTHQTTKLSLYCKDGHDRQTMRQKSVGGILTSPMWSGVNVRHHKTSACSRVTSRGN